MTVPRHSIEILATDADVDDVGHVSNIVYVKWIQEVALAHSIAAGWDFPAYQAFGAVFVVRRHEVDYIAPVVAGQTITATTWVDGFRPASCVRHTELTRDGKVVARGQTTWALMSLSTGRPQRIPEHLVEAFIAASRA